MGPDGLLAGTFGLIVTGIIEQDHVYVPVIVRIVIGNVYLILE